MRIVFHGANAATFVPGFAALLRRAARDDRAVRRCRRRHRGEAAPLAAADVVIGVRLTADMPRLSARLYQVAGAGTDGIDMAALPAGLRALQRLRARSRHRRIRDVGAAGAACAAGRGRCAAAPRRLALLGRQAHRPAQRAGRADASASSASAISARRWRRGPLAFGMRVEAANRSAVAAPQLARVWPLDRLAEMAAGVDVLIEHPAADARRPAG